MSEFLFQEELDKLLTMLVSCRMLVLSKDQSPRLLTLDDVLQSLDKSGLSEGTGTIEALALVQMVRGFIYGNPLPRQLWAMVVEIVEQDDWRAKYAQRVLEFVTLVSRALDESDEAKQQLAAKPWEELERAAWDMGLGLTLNELSTMIALALAEHDQLQESKKPGRLGMVTAG